MPPDTMGASLGSEVRGRVPRYGVGVLGLGVMGRFLAARFAESERFDVVAAYDPAEPRDVPYPLLGSAEAVAHEPSVDCLYLASPPARHAEGVRLALAAHKPVLCEKPLAPTREVAQELSDAVGDAGLPAAVNFGFGTSAIGRSIARAVDERLLGDVKHARLVGRFRQWPRPWQASAGPWLTSPDEGGFTREVFSHFVALGDRLFGPGKVVESRVRRGEDGLESRVEATIAHGAIAFQIEGEIDSGAPEDDSLVFTVACESGELVIEDWEKAIGFPVDDTRAQGAPPAFAELLDTGRADIPDFATGARVVHVIEDILGTGR